MEATLVYKIAQKGGGYFFDGSFAAVEEITFLKINIPASEAFL